MTRTLFNLEALVAVDIVDKKVCGYIEWRPFKASFWGDQQEGYYTTASFTNYIIGTEKEIEEGLLGGVFKGLKFIIENKKVYYLPYVKLTFAGDRTSIREFKEYGWAAEFGKIIADTHIPKNKQYDPNYKNMEDY